MSHTVSLFSESLGFMTSLGGEKKEEADEKLSFYQPNFRERCFQATSKVDKVSLPVREGSSPPSLSYFIIVILYVTWITAGPAMADVT